VLLAADFFYPGQAICLLKITSGTLFLPNCMTMTKQQGCTDGMIFETRMNNNRRLSTIRKIISVNLWFLIKQIFN